MRTKVTRRTFVASALGAGVLTAAARARQRPDYTFVQYHNQPESSELHKSLAAMWTRIESDTHGRVSARVFANNNHITGSDPAALAALRAGDIQFFTLMGGILGTVVPAAEVQQLPFVFRSAAHALHLMDGGLGAYLRDEMSANGLVGFAGGTFDNGMRQIAGTKRPIARPDDLPGIRMRVPAGALVADTFRALGAEPITINSDGIYEALASGRVDAQENPLGLVELFKLYEVVNYVSLTNHMWSGFNLLAHQPTWTRLPPDIRTTIERNVVRSARRQRDSQEHLNRVAAPAQLARRGLRFNDVDPAPFRARLADLRAVWKERLGSRCWSLLDIP